MMDQIQLNAQVVVAMKDLIGTVVQMADIVQQKLRIAKFLEVPILMIANTMVIRMWILVLNVTVNVNGVLGTVLILLKIAASVRKYYIIVPINVTKIYWLS